VQQLSANMSGFCSEEGKTYLFEEGMACQRAGRRSVEDMTSISIYMHHKSITYLVTLYKKVSFVNIS